MSVLLSNICSKYNIVDTLVSTVGLSPLQNRCPKFSPLVIPYSALIWRSSILAIGDLKSKSPFLKPPIINAHAHSNAHVKQITKLKTVNYIFMR